jgi:hypothetical protein
MRSSETSVHTRTTRRHIPENGILYKQIFRKFAGDLVLPRQPFIIPSIPDGMRCARRLVCAVPPLSTPETIYFTIFTIVL